MKTEEQRRVALDTWKKIEVCDFAETYTYFSFVDSKDLYRINYIKRKRKFPASIIFTLTEGMTEDFFDPDINWSIIFPIP